MITDEEYERAYKEWYCVTAKNPVSLAEYKRMMSRFAGDVRQINQWLAEGKQPLRTSHGSSEHLSVVYYESDGHPTAFYVLNATTKKLQEEFDNNDVASIKNITIESDRLTDRRFKTLFLEQDIAAFLRDWGINY